MKDVNISFFAITYFKDGSKDGTAPVVIGVTSISD
jgi:hypothetical protein